ncbi:MAG TPA: homoserine dehydrogenase [Acidimicrobiaceae bacterium]|nr:homoserine dehydrogenase [Acidimicrobiaceae bacterium]
MRVGVLGCGTVGGAFVALLERDAGHIAARTGIDFEVTRVAVRNLSAPRTVRPADGVLTRDTEALVVADDVDVVVEVIGGIEPARRLVVAALRAGKPVVTANKELVANVGEELFDAARAAGVDLLFEAAVAAGIPLVGVLARTLAGERVNRVMGIVNGTTNFILTKMTDDGAAYADALAEAQRLGYAEADPTADVEGFDAGAKAAILAMTAFGAKVVAGDVYQEGIAGVRPADIEAARRMGHVIKLLAVAERVRTPPADDAAADDAAADGADIGEVTVRVHPTMVPADHPLAAVRDSFNAVFLQGEAVGDLMLYGRGAGGFPTASAVLGDVIAAAVNLRKGVSFDLGPLTPVRLRPIDETSSAFHVSIAVTDEPGVLAAVAGVFGAHDVSIRSMEQTAAPEGRDDDPAGGTGEAAGSGHAAPAAAGAGAGATAHLEFITHRAREADVQATLRDLRELAQVRSVGTPIRVIGE